MTKRVPAELHHELAEYASLLRALRVRDAMDVTKHITQPNPFASTSARDTDLNSADDLPADDVTDEISMFSSYPPSPRPSSTRPSSSRSQSPQELPKSAKARGKQKAGPVPAGKKRKPRRDHWTRWPLPLEDVPTPEWTLEDEVAVLVAQAMRGRPQPTFPVTPAAGPPVRGEEPVFAALDLTHDEDDPEHPLCVPYVTAAIAEYLAIVFAALACLIPARTAGFQNRIEPLGWRTVLDALVACAPSELVHAQIVERVTARMEAIYGLSIIPLEGEKSTSLRAVERINAKIAATQRFNARIDGEAAVYWDTSMPPSVEPQPPESSSLRKRKKAQDEDEAETSSGSKAPRKRKRMPKRASAPRVTTVENTDDEPDRAIPPVPQDEQTSTAATEPLRRSTRARTTREYNFPSEDVFMD
ncbi:hypothetical protein HYPSUDRAFT_70401 [Hypholoma sublateritium FD-334 SS-4]|uniref:Uncharacterized protein n=1 Tax=Hypholoma sublateritium (strain FD-334 SS-4) TaxID=945553 RepID=A0A0D2PBV8_HYPSF|nr:hypothetical protein HYPSUDRAFT_70401 [Hypholoma sublateritium FD-334 SS-4]